MSEERKCLYAGSFDPWTKGHDDVLRAAKDMFDSVLVAILTNPQKKDPMFTESQRMNMLSEHIEINYGPPDPTPITIIGEKDTPAYVVAREHDCGWFVRGLRKPMEYEEELMMHFINSDITPRVQTIFVPSNQEHIHISSNAVRAAIHLGETTHIRSWVPINIYHQIVDITSH